MEVVVNPLGCLINVEPLAQLRVLSCDADWATAGVAVVTLASLNAVGAHVVGYALDLLVAVHRDQRAVTHRDGLCTEREALGHVATVADAASDDEIDLVGEANILKRAARLRDRRHQRNAGLFGREVRPSGGAAFGAVEVDDVGPALGGHADVVVNARCADLQLDRHLVIGCFAHLLDLQREVVRSKPIGVAGR